MFALPSVNVSTDHQGGLSILEFELIKDRKNMKLIALNKNVNGLLSLQKKGNQKI